MCSTPEGIGSGTTRGEVSESTWWPPRAQRPKASEAERQGSGVFFWAPVEVLNARRHRKRNDAYLYQTSACAWKVLNARRHRKRNDHQNPLRLERLRMCSTPEGIGSGTTRRGGIGSVVGRVLNARRHRKRNDLVGDYGIPGAPTVLNARRHRKRNDIASARVSGDRLACSTPEGIGSGTPPSRIVKFTLGMLCSTPEGIGSGTTRLQAEKARQYTRCSTPEGIGSGTTSTS